MIESPEGYSPDQRCTRTKQLERFVHYWNQFRLSTEAGQELEAIDSLTQLARHSSLFYLDHDPVDVLPFSLVEFDTRGPYILQDGRFNGNGLEFIVDIQRTKLSCPIHRIRPMLKGVTLVLDQDGYPPPLLIASKSPRTLIKTRHKTSFRNVLTGGNCFLVAKGTEENFEYYYPRLYEVFQTIQERTILEYPINAADLDLSETDQPREVSLRSLTPFRASFPSDASRN